MLYSATEAIPAMATVEIPVRAESTYDMCNRPFETEGYPRFCERVKGHKGKHWATDPWRSTGMWEN